MTKKTIMSRWSALERARSAAKAKELEVSRAVREYLEDKPVRSLALAMGVSAAYVSDVRHGRRAVSEEFFVKLMAVKL